MEARYLRRVNDEGVEERFYPITHADAVIDLPKTASDVGAYTKEEVDDLVENATPDGVLLADGSVTMTGDFKMSKTYPELRLTNTRSGRSAILQAYPDYTEVGDYDNSSNYRMLRIKPASEGVADGVTIAQMNGGAWNNYKLYGEHNVTKGTTDLTAGSSPLANGCIHIVYE